MSRELDEAYRSVIASWGPREGDGSLELTKAFTEELLNHLPDLDLGILGTCVHASDLFILHNSGKFPSRQEMKKGFKKICEDCRAMEAAFASMGPNIHYALQCGFSLAPNRSKNEPDFNLKLFIDNFKNVADSIGVYAERYLEIIPSRGPHKDLVTNQLIESLAMAYEAATGKPARRGVIADSDHKGFHGKFFELVLGCTNALEKRYHSDEALGERIRSVLSTRDKTT